MKKNKKTVLIIDDDKALSKAIKIVLTNNGYDVLSADDGEIGLSMCIEKKPDLTLLDIFMPKRDGLWILNELRKDDWGKSANVIFLTNVGATSPEIVSSVIKNKPLYFFVKSEISLKDIVKKISIVFKSKQI